METQSQAKGLFVALFDFSFTSFVTSKIIKFLYGLGLGLGALFGLYSLFSAFREGETAALLALVLVPLLYLLFAMYLRVTLELMMVIFRIAEHTEEIARRGRTP